MKKLVVILFVILFMSLVSVNVLASELGDEVNIFYDADISMNLPETYNAGDVVDSAITVDNQEDFPIVDGVLIVEVLKGCEEPMYPSQFSDCDNIFDEIIIDKVNVPARSTINVPFSYTLDSDLSSGTYRMDFAFRTEKTPIVGMPHILLTSKYQFFEVTGEGSFPYANIIRTQTNIEDQAGPIGVGIDPGEEFILDVYVDSEKAQVATLEVSICDWQDSICNLISSESKNVNLEVGEQLIPVALITPDSPDAYAIRIELKDSDGLVSLYRSRVVVLGKMAKIRKLYTDNYYYNNESMKVNVLVAGSPDHYTNPIVEDIFLKVAVSDLVKDVVVGVKTKVIGDLDSENLFAKADFEFDVVGKLYEFLTCAELLVEFNESFDDEGSSGSICVYNGITGEAVDSELFVSVKQGALIVVQERRVVDNCFDLVFDMEKGKNYDILVQDMRTNQDFYFDMKQDKVFLGISVDIWLYVILAGIAIIILILIVIVAKNRKRLKRYG